MFCSCSVEASTAGVQSQIMRSLKTVILEEAQGEGFARPDVIAGFTVAVVALPLAVAFGVASEMGAAAGLVSAIVAGTIAALMGGSRFQVSGPTGAMTVVLLPIVHKVGIGGVLAAGFLAGALLVAAGLMKLGSHIHRLPVSLIEGFTAGIAIVIALQQVPLVWGLHDRGDHVFQVAWDSVTHASALVSASSIMAVVSAAILIVLRHRWTLWPKSLIVVAFATAGTAALGLDVPTVGDLPSNLFSFSTDFLSDFSTVAVIIPPAISIAVLAALESLLSAKVADKLKGDGSVHDSDKELVGQGLANLVTPLFGGVPATAALARTAVNVHAGARTRLAAVSHSVVLAVAVLLFASQVALIPIPALAGVLWATTAQMIKISELRAEANASHLDALILVMTLVLTVVLDLIVAVAVGTMLWLALRNRLTSGREPLVNDDETFGD
ncbi:MAG: hypothetical protein RL441_262 [Actinomycetota bacterium]